jgi:hypothetical protein
VCSQHTTQCSGCPQHVDCKGRVAGGHVGSTTCQHTTEQAQVDGILAGQVEGLAVQDALQLAEGNSLQNTPK